MRLVQIISLAVAILPTFAKQIKLTGLECKTFDPKFCVFEKCIIKAQNRDVKELSITAKMLQLPLTNVTLRGSINPRFKPVFYSFQVDACVFMQSTRRNPIANAIYKFLRMETYSNINHSCPYNHDLILDRIRIENNLNLPLPFGAGEYVITGNWYNYSVLRAIVRIYFAISAN